MKINLDMSLSEFTAMVDKSSQAQEKLAALQADYNALQTRFYELKETNRNLEFDRDLFRRSLATLKESHEFLAQKNLQLETKIEVYTKAEGEKTFMEKITPIVQTLRDPKKARSVLGDNYPNNKIACIKYIRTSADLGLKEAKDLFELVVTPEYAVNPSSYIKNLIAQVPTEDSVDKN